MWADWINNVIVERVRVWPFMKISRRGLVKRYEYPRSTSLA